MTTFSFYDLATGAIHPLSVSDSRFPDAPDPAQIPAGHAPIAGAFDRNIQLIDLGTLLAVNRGACPITSAVAGRVVTLSGVPSGAPYAITGNALLTGNADGSGTLALTFGAAGTYAIAIPCFPLLDYTGSFTLT